MKTKNYIIGTVLSVCSLLFAFAPPAEGQTAQSRRFTAPEYTMAGTSLAYLFGATNQYAGGFVQTNSGTYPYVSSYSPLWVTNTGGISDVALWANRDGTAPLAHICIDIQGTAANATNQVVFNFVGMPHLRTELGIPNNPANTAPNASLTLNLTMNGTNDICFTTNLNTSTIQGYHALRLSSICCTNGAALATTNIIHGVWLDGFTPD